MKANGALRFSNSGLIIIGALLLEMPLLRAEKPAIRSSAQPAVGALFIVNNTGDENDAAQGDGFCETVSGNSQCTLRAAIQEANAHAGTDGIRFTIPTSDPGFDPGTGRYTINLATPLPDLSTDMNMTGLGADKLTVRRDSVVTFRIFNVTT